MRNQQMELVKEFLTAFSRSDLANHRGIFAEDAAVVSSAQGTFYGIDAIVNGLSLPEEFDDATVTMVNTLCYQDNDTTVITTTGQHYNANEDSPYLFAVVYGGKYVFVVKDGRIEKISFVLEYQAENTYYLHTWNLSDGHNDYTAYHSLYDGMKQYHAIMAIEDRQEKAGALTRLFFNSLDTKDMAVLDVLLRDDAVLSREKTYSNGRIEGTKNSLAAYLEEEENYYDLNEHAVRINSVSCMDDGYAADVQLLSPQRLNTKKLYIGNKYSSFYDEGGTVVFDENFRIVSMKLEKVAEIALNGFDVLEV